MIEYHQDQYTVSTDPARLNIALIHEFLNRHAYWSQGIPLDIVQKSIQHSLCFGVYEGDQQVGFARVVTDRATFAYLADVFILESHRQRGLSKWLIACVLAHPDLQNMRRILLATRDAHGLYAQFGFTQLAHPDRFMERHRPDIYATSVHPKQGE